MKLPAVRGTAGALMDMALNPEYAEALAERAGGAPYSLLYPSARGGRAVLLVVIGDDLGSQEKLIFSPRMVRRIYKPRLRRLIEHIHSLAPQAKVYMHSDGAIASIIPDLIEIGVQGLNPVQYTAKGMDTSFLKSEFGKDLGFFGGTIDNASSALAHRMK
jgi:uroporphyrinogen decarboxylase